MTDHDETPKDELPIEDEKPSIERKSGAETTSARRVVVRDVEDDDEDPVEDELDSEDPESFDDDDTEEEGDDTEEDRQFDDEDSDFEDDYNDDDDLDSGDQGGRGRNDLPERRTGFKDARELLVDELQVRVQRANPRLRGHLTGIVVVNVRGSGKKYLFDWRNEAPVIQEADSEAADCNISVSQDNLFRIASGELNPQIAMLSDKIHVTGNLAFAVYFFNLIAPRSMPA